MFHRWRVSHNNGWPHSVIICKKVKRKDHDGGGWQILNLAEAAADDSDTVEIHVIGRTGKAADNFAIYEMAGSGIMGRVHCEIPIISYLNSGIHQTKKKEKV